MKLDLLSTMWTSMVLQVLLGLLADITGAVYTEYKDLSVDNFSGCCDSDCQPSSEPSYYRYIQQSPSKPGLIYVGAMNYVYALNTSTPTISCTNSQHLPQMDNKKERCTRQGKAEIPDCQNHIREVFEISDSLLEVCGTGAYSPLMYYLNVHNMTINHTGDSSKLPTCPYDPLDNYTLLHSESGNPGNSSAMYFGFYMDFIKNFPVFLRTPYTYEGTKYVEKMTDTEDANWLNSPQFVGSFDMDNSVMMFFREKEKKEGRGIKKVYSRIGKVCKNDLGGGSVEHARKKWLSFQKARLICSLPGDQPYYFDDIYDVAYDGRKYFYALFYKPGADLNASAVCVYDTSIIKNAFAGTFMWNNGTIVASSNTEPRLDDCQIHDSNPNAFVGQSSHHQLMSTSVQPVSGKPIFYKQGIELLRLALGPLKVNEQANKELRNIYIGTSEGEVYDVFVEEEQWKTYLNTILYPFENTPQPKRPIWNMKLKNQTNYLIVGTDYSVTKVPLDICARINGKQNNSVYHNLDECLYNTRCKLASCGNVWKCVQADNMDCDTTITAADVSGKPLRQFLLDEIKYKVKVIDSRAIRTLYTTLSVDYPLRLDGVLWKKDGHILEDEGKYAFSKNELVLKSLETSDTGKYTAEDLEGEEVAIYQLHVDEEDDENIKKVWKQEFIEWSTEFKKWKSCAASYLDSCAAVPSQ